MADIYFDVDAALAEVAVNALPIVDAATGATIKTDLAYNAAGMALFWHFVTPAGAHTVTAVTPTTAGVHDWAAQSTSGIYTLEVPASGGTINNDTEGFGWFTGFATGYLPWRSPVYGFRASGLNDLLIEGAYSATRGLAGTALPNAAADAAGGLPISDAGGLDLDAALAKLTGALTEAYRADGATGTFTQLLYEIVAHLGESSITSTTKTIKKIDGSTTAATFTLNDATTPTSITRAT